MNRERSRRVGLDLRLSQADLALRLHGEHADANPREIRGRRARAFELNPARNRQAGPKRERHVDDVLPVDDDVGPCPVRWPWWASRRERRSSGLHRRLRLREDGIGTGRHSRERERAVLRRRRAPEHVEGKPLRSASDQLYRHGLRIHAFRNGDAAFHLCGVDQRHRKVDAGSFLRCANLDGDRLSGDRRSWIEHRRVADRARPHLWIRAGIVRASRTR